MSFFSRLLGVSAPVPKSRSDPFLVLHVLAAERSQRNAQEREELRKIRARKPAGLEKLPWGDDDVAGLMTEEQLGPLREGKLGPTGYLWWISRLRWFETYRLLRTHRKSLVILVEALLERLEDEVAQDAELAEAIKTFRESGLLEMDKDWEP